MKKNNDGLAANIGESGIKIRNTSKAQPFPRDHQKHTLISIDDSAHYTITPELQHIYDSI